MKNNLIKNVLIMGIALCLCGQSFAVRQFHHPEQFIKKLQGDKQAGKKIYRQFCQLCHAINPQIDVGAPRIGVSEDWQHRMKQGLNTMLRNIDNGMNAMPARGGCFECSDEQLKAAIKYMLAPRVEEKKNTKE